MTANITKFTLGSEDSLRRGSDMPQKASQSTFRQVASIATCVQSLAANHSDNSRRSAVKPVRFS